MAAEKTDVPTHRQAGRSNRALSHDRLLVLVREIALRLHLIDVHAIQPSLLGPFCARLADLLGRETAPDFLLLFADDLVWVLRRLSRRLLLLHRLRALC